VSQLNFSGPRGEPVAWGRVDFDLIPKKLTLTAGTRYSRTETSEVGSAVGSSGCWLGFILPAPNPCLNRYSTDINAEGLDRTFSGFRSRANLSWKVSEDALLYYTWSQGFRAGGFNRSPFQPAVVQSHNGKSPPDHRFAIEL
jgi:iron complex outermembrane recepter protein